MNVTDAIQNRYSVRAFEKRPVPEDTIREVIKLASLSPSHSNTQPWHIAVVSGQARHDLEQAWFAHMKGGGLPNPSFVPGAKSIGGVFKERQYDCAFRYYGTMNIAREDKRARQKLAAKNFQFFGAPHVAFISMPKSMHESNALDVGIFLQSLMLLFAERGIATCPQGALSYYPEVVSQFADIPEENGLLCGMSFGFEEKGAQINSLRQPRASLDEIASFVS